MTALKIGRSAGRWKLGALAFYYLKSSICNRKPWPRAQMGGCIGGERLSSDRLQAWNWNVLEGKSEL